MGFFSKIKKLWKKKEEPTPEKIEPSIKEKETLTPDIEEKKVVTEDKPAIIDTNWQKSVRQALANAEPKLSIWLDHLLEGVEKKGDELWARLHFLFENLEAPREEADEFIARFAHWLDEMDYEDIFEFRSELQYRLALALDLEDEEDERNRLFLKLSEGLSKTKEQLSRRIDQLLSITSKFDDEFWEELEEILIMADVGFTATQKLLDQLRPKVRKEKIEDAEGFKELLKQELASLFPEPRKIRVSKPPEVVLMIGVNGVGKTTTIAKLAHRAQMQGKKVMMVAGDTFRAAAIEQLNIWAKRVGAGFYAKEDGADPAAVAYEALDKAIEEGYDTVFVDTAGRLHTKVNLMDELKKIKRVVSKKHPGAPHRTILVLDATTGQNALSQTQLFSEAVPIDEIVLTKLDGTAKGGVIVAIALEHNIPITFIGLGEKMEDLRPFNGQDFATALLS